MKRFALAFFVCFCLAMQLHAQECEVVSDGHLNITYPATRINLLDDNHLDMAKMPLLEPTVENFSNLSSVYWAYQTRSDSSVVVFVAEDCLTFFKICASQMECDSLEKRFLVEDVVADEFMRLQEAGVFRGTASEADSVIHHILEKMSSIRPSGLASISYNMFRKNEDAAEIFLSSGEFCTYYGKTPRPYFCGLVDTVRQCGPSFREQYPLSLKSPVPQVPIQGMQFRAFDLNGNLIRSGKWREEYADEFRTPTIVRFENGLAVPLPRKKVH